MQNIRQKLLATFQVEHRDHVEQIRSLLAMIAQTGGQPAEAQLEEVYRRAHTLKGAARVVDLGSVEGLAHRLETLFAQVRQGSLPLNEDAIDSVQKALDAMEDSVAGMGSGEAASSLAPALRNIERLLGIEPQAAAPAPEVPPDLSVFHPIETMRVSSQNFDGLLRSAVELLTESQSQGRLTAQLNAIVTQAAHLEKEAEKSLRLSARMPDSAESARALAGIRSHLSSLQRQARSLSMQTSLVRRMYQRSGWKMTRLGKQLQRDVWQARMVPIESVLEGYRKMMRDLARDESKQIDFRVNSSGETADRRVLEALKDPLMHALRNAVSHGIEFPQDRVARGKPAEGVVTLRVDVDGQRLKISVDDDGRGVDTAKVLELAVQRKLLPDADAANPSQRDVARILFSPGFSTSTAVTRLSGRGMGLSVVYEAVRRLHGDLEIGPRPAGGTSLRISVPVSISTHNLLLISCGGQSFAIPFHLVERLRRVPREDVLTAEGQPVIALDGQTVPLYNLERLLNIPSQSDAPALSKMPVAILRSRGDRLAVAVDAFQGQCEAVIHDLGLASPHNGKICGGVLLEDGSVALVLNPSSLLDSSGRAESPATPVAAQPASKRPTSSILVVDDSITTRTLEKSILEAHGYRVRTAVDGLEALAQLRTEMADLVISDVQMPRMDGFELLEAIKNDRRLAKIPVIVVTSLERREDRERGLRLGADAYIVKRKFDQGELLATIRQIL